MPRQRPAASGYARLAQADEDDTRFSLESDDDLHNATNTLSTRYESIIPPGPRDAMRSGQHTPTRKRTRHRNRGRSNSSGVDIKAINARLERWAEEIASKFKISSVKGKSHEEEKLEIHHSVFQAPDGVKPLTASQLAVYRPPPDRFTRDDFESIVESVRVAIEQGVHPKMISQGSSGSYFARNSDGKVVGVFKPKDEEPYASRNPKWTKWIHRNLFPCFFGRACLIPNLSYVSEAAAYVLDEQLRTNLVPYTDIVWLTSKSFFYDFWQRTSFRRGKKPLPAKPGSFQVFLKGYKDANIFLREHPWPDTNSTGEFREDLEHSSKRKPYRLCVPGAAVSDDEVDGSRVMSPPPQPEIPRFSWTPTLKQALREELEKLVILDYIMRNTDRGLDNWMIKIDWKSEEVSIVAEPPKANETVPSDLEVRAPRPVSISPRPESNTSRPYKRYEAMESRSSTPLDTKEERGPTVKIGAIDNSLSWPWKHPDAWRSFPFGWLFLPVSLIGQPFSQKTRDHFLPLLTSTAWWSETQTALRKIFAQDDDFKESMFARQIAVMKGQAWNVVETLKQADHGPLELTRRTRVCVWDDLVDVPVAIPMRASSTELARKNAKTRVQDEEEMDIGVGHSSAPTKASLDLLSSSATELPNPNRFELMREDSSYDIHDGDMINNNIERPVSPSTINNIDWRASDATLAREASNHLAMSASMTLPARPSMKKSTRFSFDFSSPSSRNKFGSGKEGRRRQRSASTRSRDGKFLSMGYEGDDLEGDLGYAAASDMEGNRRKVIVERLEAVKSKNPVFTWC